MTLDIFGFRALWSPYFMLFLIGVALLYFLGTTVYRQKICSVSEPLAKKHVVFFCVTVVLLYIVKGSPVDLLGHIMFSVHMTQMALLYLLIPPIFILAIPKWLWRPFLQISIIKPLFSFFTKPLIALFLFVGMFSLYHIPIIFDAVKTDMLLHAVYTTVLFAAAICTWWPLVNELEEYQGFLGLKRIGYIFANGILLTPACALIIFADLPMYQTYSDSAFWLKAMELCVPAGMLATLDLSGPEMFNSMSLLEDQRTGGVIMKIIQELVYGFFMAKIFYAWFRTESKDSIDMNPKVGEL
ncbi:cytochrome c oxidase assembly factor CtaG [Bacillus sp. AGMB 02131]|uniref:Cytochrome c oxidase assembly factor CtaG n=1 Tax=Peribacillus faecalis TaxID=2772559 RepID=A0A927H9G2_9BACI|nr:cytochrome c oxidase assembly factor CtaG [Peribacillus faecalis]